MGPHRRQHPKRVKQTPDPQEEHPAKRGRRRKKRLVRQHSINLSVAINANTMMQTVLENLNVQIQQLTTIFNPAAWFAYTHAVPPPHVKPSFESATESLDQGVQLLESSTRDLLRVQLPDFERYRPVRKPRKTGPTASPFFPKTERAAPSTSPKKATPKVSAHFETDPFSKIPTPKGLCFELRGSGYGLIQERICGDLFALVVQAILWNQTTAKAGRPVLFKLLTTYPSPERLARASPDDVLDMIRCLGLQSIRSKRLVKMAQMWVDAPPCASRRYGKKNYPSPGDNIDVRDGELLEVDDIRAGWEIGHLPGVGDYALDSYRIFFRDTLRGIVEGDGNEPEWKRVLPLDKDLRPYLVWRWAKEGWFWDPVTGHRKRIRRSSRLLMERVGSGSGDRGIG